MRQCLTLKMTRSGNPPQVFFFTGSLMRSPSISIFNLHYSVPVGGNEAALPDDPVQFENLTSQGLGHALSVMFWNTDQLKVS